MHKYNLKDFKFYHLEQNLLLHPYKSLFWAEQKILFFSDVHFGKATHFRKSGIPISEEIHHEDFSRIIFLINHYQPQRVIILGDLFHSAYNSSWKIFKIFCETEITIKLELVMGNHDIMDYKQYDFLQLHTGNLIIDPFILSHKPLNNKEINNYYNLCGHIHPSIKISGTAKQSFRVECFYFTKNQGILPAFGNFTGTSKMTRNTPEDEIFAVTEDEIIHLT